MPLASLCGPVDGLGLATIQAYPSLAAGLSLSVKERVAANLMRLVDTNKNGTVREKVMQLLLQFFLLVGCC
jgi:hypothetical protein